MRQTRTVILTMLAICLPSVATAQPIPSNQLPEQMVPVGQGYGGVIPPEAPPDLSDPNFQASLRNLAPLTPGQIRETKRVIDQDQKAEAAPPEGMPTSTVRSITLTLQPGEQPPVLNLFQGNVTSLVFSDATGQPWPVTSVTVGDKSTVSANIAGNSLVKAVSPSAGGSVDGSNVVTMSPLTANVLAQNVVVTLQGLDIPVIGEIKAGGSKVDYRVDITIEKRGPNAADDVSFSTVGQVGSPTLQDFVDGIPPKGTTTLQSSDPSIQAWYLDGQMYLRTDSVDLLSPAYTSRATNISGVELFALPATPDIIVDRNGSPTSVTISGFPASYDQSQD